MYRIDQRPNTDTESVGTVPDHIWDYFTSLRQEVGSYIPRVEKFVDGLEDEQEKQAISKDFEWAERMKREIRMKDEDVEMGSLAEAVLFGLPSQYGWYGDEKDRVRVTTVNTTDYDDFRDGADLVREIVLPGGEILRWIEDITVAHPATTSGRARDVLQEKTREPLQRSAEGKDSGAIKYFESVEDPHLLTRELFYMPRIVVSLPRSVIIELAELDQEVRDGDKDAVEKLRRHPARREYLAQLRTALEAYRALAGAFVEDVKNLGRGFVDQKRLNLAKSIVAEIDNLIGALPGLRDVSPDDMGNEWLKDVYSKALE